MGLKPPGRRTMNSHETENKRCAAAHTAERLREISIALECKIVNNPVKIHFFGVDYSLSSTINRPLSLIIYTNRGKNEIWCH